MVAAAVFALSASMDAFTAAFQVPNLVRALFADAALQGAFVPVFTELLERGERREAFRVASSLFTLLCVVLGGLTLLFMLLAPTIMALVVPGFEQESSGLTIGLARLMLSLIHI